MTSMTTFKPPTRPNIDAPLFKFLDGLPIPSLTPEHKDSLEAPFPDGEVLGVIKTLKTGSAPCPDGLSNPYYKTFSNTLVTQD